MRAGPAFERLSAIGAAAQASVPGAYAWGVTVVPCAWAGGTATVAGGAPPAAVVAKVAAVVGIVALAAGVAAERRWGSTARVASLWGFVVSSAVVWWGAPAGLAATHLDAPQGFAGMLGWALFAVASAAPAVPSARRVARAVEDEAPPSPFVAEVAEEGRGPLVPRERPVRGDLAYVGVAAVVAAVLQTIGWHAGGAERTLLARLVALASGLAVIGAGAQLALARHAPRPIAPARLRLRRATAALVALALLVAAGVLFALRD